MPYSANGTGLGQPGILEILGGGKVSRTLTAVEETAQSIASPNWAKIALYGSVGLLLGGFVWGVGMALADRVVRRR